jgi:predicted outer membrane lipoprotein
MWYFVALLGLGVALAAAGFIQVLWLETASMLLEGPALPQEDAADESAENRCEDGLARPGPGPHF